MIDGMLLMQIFRTQSYDCLAQAGATMDIKDLTPKQSRTLRVIALTCM